MKWLRRRLIAILTAAGVGAVAAVLRRRGRGLVSTEPADLAVPVGSATPTEAPAPIPPDAQAAIDEARDRLRARAEALRQEIDGDSDPR